MLFINRVISTLLTLLLSVTTLVIAPGGSNQLVASATESTNTADAPQLKISGFDQVGPYPVGIKSASFGDWDSYTNPPVGYSSRYTSLYVCDLSRGDFADLDARNRYGEWWCLGFGVDPIGGWGESDSRTRKYTAKEKNYALERIRKHIKPTDSFVKAYKIFLVQEYNHSDNQYGSDRRAISEPITIFDQSPRVLGRDFDRPVSSNLFYTRSPLGNSIDFDWYECSKYSSKPQTRVRSGCSRLGEDLLNSGGVRFNTRWGLGKYLALRVTGADGSFQYFSKTTSAIRKLPLAIWLEPTNSDDSDSTSLSAPIGTTYKLTLSTGLPSSLNDPHIGNYKCPKSALVSIKNLASGYVSRKTIKLSSSSGGDPADCTGRINVSVQANMRVQVELPSSYWTSKSTETIVVKGEPSLSASAPKRAFDSYVLRLKANRPVTTTCNVREEYFSFGGDLIATKWFSISLRYGYATKKRTTYYVGVIRAMVTCKSTSKYDVAIDTYKVFSY